MHQFVQTRFELQVRVSMVCSSWVNAVLVCDDLPELGTDLVSALASLDVHKLAHGCRKLQAEGHGLCILLRAQGKHVKTETS